LFGLIFIICRIFVGKTLIIADCVKWNKDQKVYIVIAVVVIHVNNFPLMFFRKPAIVAI